MPACPDPVPCAHARSWQCLMMPVTPGTMMSLLDAPVPFVLGLQYKTPEVVARCADLIRVNVYKVGRGWLGVVGGGLQGRSSRTYSLINPPVSR
jgi:hypothetical protein